MNEEIPCITNKGKMAKNEWYTVYIKIRTVLFPYLLTCIKKDTSVLFKVTNI